MLTETRSRLDLSKLKTLKKKAKKAFSIFGGVDVLVHNGGSALRDLVPNTDVRIDKKIAVKILEKAKKNKEEIL